MHTENPRPLSTLGELSTRRVDAHGHPVGRGEGGIDFDLDGHTMESVVHDHNLGAVLASIRLPDGGLEAAAEPILQTARRLPHVVPLLWIEPGQGDSADDAEAWVRRGGFAGLKVHPHRDGIGSDDPAMDPFAELCARLQLPMVIHTAADDPSLPERVGRLAQRHPQAPLVLYHGGLGTDHAAAVEVVKANPNTWFELSWVGYDAGRHAIEQLGAQRVLFGTDVSVDGPHHYRHGWGGGPGDGTWEAYLQHLGRELPWPDYRAVVCRNAHALFHLVTVHVRSEEPPTLAFDRGDGFGEAWPMVDEGNGWHRRVVPSRGPVAVRIDGGDPLVLHGWEHWLDGGLLVEPAPTTIEVAYDVGYEHHVALRGGSYPLSWHVGEPAAWGDGHVWRLTLPGVVAPLPFKALVDDLHWEEGDDHWVQPGETARVSPRF